MRHGRTERILRSAQKPLNPTRTLWLPLPLCLVRPEGAAPVARSCRFRLQAAHERPRTLISVCLEWHGRLACRELVRNPEAEFSHQSPCPGKWGVACAPRCQFASMAILLTGLLALFFTLDAQAGTARWAGR